MDKIQTQRGESNYRWVILVVAVLTHTFSSGIQSMCLPVLFKEISQEMGLNLVQIGAVWGLGSLTGLFTSLVGGTLGDRFGSKRTLMIACILTGAAGALRGLSTDFTSLSLTVLLYGFISPLIPVNVHKTCGTWFSERQLGLANGFAAMGMALGYVLGSIVSATILSPWLGGWRNVLFLYGMISVFVGILWHFTRSEPKDATMPAEQESPLPRGQTLAYILRMKNTWLFGITALGLNGCVQGLLGYLPLYLQGIGWAEASADGALAASNSMSMLFVLPLTFLSDRLRFRKTILMVASLVIAIGVGLLAIAEGAWIWVLVLITGIFRDSFMAILITSIIETDGIGLQIAGTSVGLMIVFSQLGRLTSPPIGNSLATMGLNFPFPFWAALAAVAFVSLAFVKEKERLRE